MEIAVAIVTGLFTLTGTILSVVMSYRKVTEDLKISRAVTDTKIEELTREVREHNGFARRMPVLEEKVSQIEKRLDDGNS